MTNDPGETRRIPPAGNEDLLAGRYLLLEKVGEGGAAEVFRARDVRLDRIVAVKLLRRQYTFDQNSRQRFEVEARAAARLAHPNIVDVYDFGESEDGSMYLAMRFIEGRSLKELIARRGRLAPAEAISIARQACAALTAAHAQGLIHRDVKPQNMMVDGAGNVLLTDFGVVKALSGPALTQSGMTFGTAAYLSPEQATGEQVGPPSDLYALGCVMYEMLSGAPPFTGDNPAVVAYKQVWEQPRPLHEIAPEVPPSLESIVMRCLQKDPARRYPNAESLVSDLDRLSVSYNQPTQAVSLGQMAAYDVGAPDGLDVSAAEQSNAIPMPAPAPPVATASYQQAAVTGPPQPYLPRNPAPALSPTAQPVPRGTISTRQVNVQPRRDRGWLLAALVGLAGLVLVGGGLLLGSVMGGLGPTPTPTATLPAVVGDATATFTPQATDTPAAETTTPVPADTETPTPEVPTETPTLEPLPTDTPEPFPTDTPEPEPIPTDTAIPEEPTPTIEFVPFPTITLAPEPIPISTETVQIEDARFAGGYTSRSGTYHNVTARWVYGQGTPYSSMSATFDLDKRPRGSGGLTIRGVDSEDQPKTPIRIVLNDTTIYEGPAPFPNDTVNDPNGPGNWGEYEWGIPPNALRKGQNTLTITNLSQRDCISCPYFFMVDYAVVSWGSGGDED